MARKVKEKELVLSTERIIALLEAVSAGLAHKRIYQNSKVDGKILLLTRNFIYMGELLHAQYKAYPEDFKDRVLDREFFKDFQKKVKNEFILEKIQEKIDYMMNNMEESRQKEPEVYKVYEFIRCSELVEKLIDKEQFKPLPFNRTHYLSRVFSTLKNNFKMTARKHETFFSMPDKYMPRNRQDRYVMLHYMSVAGHMNDKASTTFMQALSKTPLDEISTAEYSNKILFGLNGESTSRKTVCTQRIDEFNNLLDDLFNAGLSFDKVVNSIIESVEYCRSNNINTYLSTTNVIMNNLIVTAFKDKHILSSKEYDLNIMIATSSNDNRITAIIMNTISTYVVDFYKDKHTRVCAHTLNIAMKQALGFMAKSEPDMFTLNI